MKYRTNTLLTIAVCTLLIGFISGAFNPYMWDTGAKILLVLVAGISFIIAWGADSESNQIKANKAKYSL